jgi:hypothetical protein
MLQKMVNYIQHDNFMEHKLPITTPIVVQISVDLVERPGSYPPSMSVGNMRGFWEMFIYLHSSVQARPPPFTLIPALTISMDTFRQIAAFGFVKKRHRETKGTSAPFVGNGDCPCFCCAAVA